MVCGVPSFGRNRYGQVNVSSRGDMRVEIVEFFVWCSIFLARSLQDLHVQCGQVNGPMIVESTSSWWNG